MIKTVLDRIIRESINSVLAERSEDAVPFDTSLCESPSFLMLLDMISIQGEQQAAFSSVLEHLIAGMRSQNERIAMLNEALGVLVDKLEAQAAENNLSVDVKLIPNSSSKKTSKPN